MNFPSVDIAIIFKDLHTPFILETIENCLNLDYKNYTLSLYPDIPVDLPVKNRKIRIRPTGNASIPVKRNAALKNLHTGCDFIAFIDADASPDKYWLKNAVRYFQYPGIIAVGGPNITPPAEEFLRKISGYVMQQEIGFGSGAIRHRICSSRYVKELPACNLIIRGSYITNHFFDISHKIGEDTRFCSDIIRNGFKIFYARDVIVYHHRRKAGRQLLRQFYDYGYYKCRSLLSDALFSREYIMPTLFSLYIVVFGILSPLFEIINIFFLFTIGLFFVICFISCLNTTKNLFSGFCTVLAIFLCHFSYGSGFLIYFLRAKILKKSNG